MSTLPSPTDPPRLRRLCDAFVIALCAATLLGQMRTVFADVDVVFAGAVLDDALYYLIPAQNFVAGRGFSFDGNHLTNGVQPLWALVSVVIAALFDDREGAVRALCGAGALCWTAAAGVLHLAWRRAAPGAGALAATLWLAAGSWRRLSLLGMENGLQGLLLAALLWFVMRRDWRTVSARTYLQLGLLTGLVGLTRTEAGLLVALLGLGVAFGLLGRLSPTRRLQVRAASLFAAAAGAVTAAWYVGSLVYFGELLPISGHAKRFYEKTWGSQFPTMLEAVEWHARFVFDIAAHGVTNAARRLTRLFGHDLDVEVLRAPLAWFVGVGAGVCALRYAWQRPRAAPSAVATGVVLVVFAVVHLILVAVLLPHFAAYGTWYFATEILTLHGLLLAALLTVLPWRARHAWRDGPLLALATVVAAFSVGLAYRRPSIDNNVHTFMRGGRWFAKHVPAGQHLGAHSSGYLNYCATGHTVTNLDGLVNDGRYLREYLQRNRFVDYLRDEGITWYADYRPLEQWKDGIAWYGTVPLSDVRLAKWWLMGDDRAYCAMRLWPQDDAQPFDPFARIQFDAIALGKHAWHKQVPTDLDPEQFVATSVATFPSGELRHVVQPWATYLAAAPVAERVLPEVAVDAVFGDALRCLGVSVEAGGTKRDAFLVVSRYWQWLQAEAAPADLVVVLRAGSREVARGPLAHGSIRKSVPAGTVLMDALRLVAPDTDGRSEPLTLSVEQRGAVLDAKGAGSLRSGVLFLQNIRWPR